MAGMFYSVKEAAEKLNKTEEEVRELAKQGKLREFRDGSNLLFKIDEVEALMSDTSVMTYEETKVASEEPVQKAEAPMPEEIPEAQLPEEMPEPQPEQKLELEPALESEQAQVSEPSAQPEQETEETGEEEISLAPETVGSEAETDLTDLDTALTGKGISVLGETDRDYQLTDDTMAETITPTGTTGEASLEEIEEDVNLDSFGSGSGLLDLSLQADDTSLGGILNEIYTTEGAEEEQEPSEPGSGVEMTAEPEQILPEEELAGPEPVPEISAVAQAYIEPEPDVQSNTLGMLLFLPLLVLLYTAVVTLTAQRGMMPSILGIIHSFIWYIVIGAILIAGLIIGAAFMLGGNFTTSLKKQKKPKKSKKAKKSETLQSEDKSA